MPGFFCLKRTDVTQSEERDIAAEEREALEIERARNEKLIKEQRERE